ncbi:carboxylesterase/lipase family protein [Antrihabitans cavernicola]|uniref:Carboxylic ester hydrolase n=1 Tax=Antrihabitans cavernicola TaxID=2495913 RepID=A0A5A7SEC5_9NOCA|nr:carboxylesterase/lipase family protein [Spelaeibacter cavernicola]KAA0023749.1 carboxylesterase/lipase family protein [Spelaeibacter cavernicola]
MNDGPIDVTTRSGTLHGVRSDGLRAWRGIPYAAPPIGSARFRAPQPAAAWSGSRDATRFGSRASQKRGKNNSEDCLTLNVLAPEQESGPRPVMVYIHGGAYVSGSSSDPLYRGDHLVRRGNVVFVSINYRLGALGYIDFTEFSDGFQSNLGLRDQVAALQWVHDNIAAFGGDPTNVTIFGESSGGNAVTTLMCTPAAAGLFARGIAESPPVASVYSAKRSQGWAADVAEAIGATGSDAADVLASVPAQRLVDVTHDLTTRWADEQPGLRATAPVVDGDYLPQHPLDAFANGSAAQVPLIIGTNSHEGRFFPRFLNIIPTNHDRIELMFAETEPRVKARALAAYPDYPGKHAAADLGGDVVFWEPTVLCAQSHAEHAPTYCYRYDYAPRLLHLTGFHATHGTELLAVFGAVDDLLGRAATLLGGRAGLRAVTDTVQEHWLSFAQRGVPESSWPAYTTERRETLIIDQHSRVESDPLGDRRQAWLGYHHRR